MIGVVVFEAVLAVGAAVATWQTRKQHPHVFLLYPLVGATWAALAHGVFFFSDGNDPGLLAGFGFAVALFIGLPVGCFAGLLAWLESRK